MRKAALTSVGILLLFGSLATGCKKKETASAPPPPAAQPEAAPQAPAPAAAGQPAPAPVIEQPVNVQASWRDSETAAKKKDYETAAASLLKVYVIAPALPEKEALDNFNRMRDLQKQIADAAAAGNPSAQRALQMMSAVHEANRRR